MNQNIFSGSRLREFREAHFKTQGELADAIGITQAVLSKYENGKSAIPDETKIKLQRLGMSLEWLITGEGEMLRKSVEDKIDTAANIVIAGLSRFIQETDDEVKTQSDRIEALGNGKVDKSDFERLKAFVYSQHPADQTDHLPDEVREKHNYYYPAIGDVSAGTPRETLPRRPLLLPKEYRFLVRGPHNLYYFARVRGESMSEIIPDGSLIFLRECFIPREGRIYLFRIDNEFTLKEYAYDEEEDRPYLLCRDGSNTQIEVRDCQTCYCVAEYVATIKEGAGE